MLTIGVVMKYWDEKTFRKRVKDALERQLIRAKNVSGVCSFQDYRDLLFQIAARGDDLFINFRISKDGRQWYDMWKEKQRYFKRIEERRAEIAIELKKNPKSKISREVLI
jgi:hypothetical protein